MTQLHTTFKVPLATFIWLLSRIYKLLGKNTKEISHILKSRRIAKTSVAESGIFQILRQDKIVNTELIFASLLRSIEGYKAEQFSVRILILKVPILEGDNVIEKGVIIIKFSETFGAIYQLTDVKLLSKYFRIILEPSWVGYSLPEILVWTGLGKEKVIVFSPYEDDFSFLSSLKMNLVPTTLGPADWANPNTFKKLPTNNKEYDCIYVANFDPIKRVDRYLRAIVKVTQVDKDFKAALVCAIHGTARTEILEVVKWAKSKANIDFFESMPQSELNVLINKSKVNVLVSLREGANKGLSEGLWAGVPALLIKECVCGNSRHINHMTGKIVPDNQLEETLLWFSDNYTQFDPRSWVENNISPHVSTHKLSELLRDIELSEGKIWTKDLYPKINAPELGYLNQDAYHLLSKREDLLNAFSCGDDIKTVNKFITTLKDN